MREPDAHETWRVAAKNLHWIALGLVGSLALVVAGMYWFAQPLLQRARDLPTPQAPPAPRLQPAPRADLAAERSREESRLTGYAWIDPEQGIARIPIERAMAIVAARGAGGQPTGGKHAQRADHSDAPQPAAEHKP